jgi:glycosyltransferase involved in cell wall biosynthesis
VAADTSGEPGRAAVRASVIVPVHDGAATLAAALSALARQEATEAYEVIVVDDGSADASAAIAERGPGPVTVLRQEQAGPAAARNRGAEAARGAVLCFTDSDCFPHSGWLAAGLAALEQADLVQGAVRPDPGAKRTPYDRTLAILRESGLYETANLFVRRELFEALGGFEVWLEPEVGKPLAEDVWFGWRARRAGARIAFCSEALVHHAVFAQRPLDVILDRRRLRYFPAIAAKVPEIRRTLFFARIFLSRRNAAFDVAVLAGAAALAARSPLPLVAASPYAWSLRRTARHWGKRGPGVAAVLAARDAVGLVSLLRGSARWRSLVL